MSYSLKFGLAVLLIVLFFSGSSFAQSRKFDPRGAPLVGTADFCPIPAYEAPNPGVASVGIFRGQRAIIIDPSVRRGDERWLKFVVAHECGHALRGHLTRRQSIARRTIKGVVEAQELDADCWAARHAPRLAVEYAYFYFRDQGPKAEGSTYPSGKARAQKIRECRGF